MYAYIKKRRFIEIYKKLFIEFLKNSTIHGVNVFFYKTMVRYGRQIWLIFLSILIVWTHYIIVSLTVNYVEQPTEIHMSTNLVHVSNSPFPGLAICSSNKFSRRKIAKYAERVFQAQQSFRPNVLANSSTEMAKKLLILAGFYVFPYDDYQLTDVRIEQLHSILTQMYSNNGTSNSTYSPRDILRDLGPDCDSLTIRALVFGIPMNTSELFFKRVTSTSVCCMFNYKRISYSNDPVVRQREDQLAQSKTQIKYESSTVLNSIHFVLQSEPDDFTYKELSNDAFQLYLFPPNDYATIQSNTAGEVFVDYDSIVEIPIRPTFFESSKSIRTFPPSVRHCYFPEEGQKILNQSYYSIDECLLFCRMQSQLKHCGCVNPTLPAPLLNANYCNLLDLPCLTRWKSVWYNWHHFDYVYNDEKQFNHENDFQFCGHCLPTCDVIYYKIHTNDLPLRKAISQKYSFGILKGLTNDKPLAIIKLFFLHLYEQANENVIVDDWVVLLNRFGGIMSLMYGFSFISCIEIFYYSCGKWFVYLKTMLQVRPGTNAEEAIPAVTTLYWRELQPKYFNKNKVHDLYRRHLFD